MYNNNNNQKNKHNNNDHDNVNCDQMDTVISMDWKLGESKNVQLSVWSCLMYPLGVQQVGNRPIYRWFAMQTGDLKNVKKCKDM
jgi:hypothetical protein